MWFPLLQDKISVCMLIIMYLLNERPIMWRFICSLYLVSKFGWSKTSLIRKILIATIIPFIINNSNIILLINSVFTFSCDKNIRTTVASKPSFYSCLYSYILKILCVPASRQSKEFNFFYSNSPQKMEIMFRIW